MTMIYKTFYTKDVDPWYLATHLEVPINRYKTKHTVYVDKDPNDISAINKAFILDTALRTIVQETNALNLNSESDRYIKFTIPKRSGGLREISAPIDSFKNILYKLTSAIEITKCLEHNAAFAYVKQRSTIDAVKVHQANQSKWFLKIDLHGFFPSTTLDYLCSQLLQVYPICYVNPDVLRQGLSCCFLEGGLPQGTPTSPVLTNLMMVPFDYAISNIMSSLNLVYTRYADDIIISSKESFNFNHIISIIKNKLLEFRAPFEINENKTRYGSNLGKNWNLGVMLNKDNNITIGYKQNMKMRAIVNNFLKDFTNGVIWNIMDLDWLNGQLSYMRMVQPDYTNFMVERLEQKYNTTFKHAYRSSLDLE